MGGGWGSAGLRREPLTLYSACVTEYATMSNEPTDDGPTAVLTVRVPRDWMELIDQEAARIAIPGRHPNRADAVRAMLLDAFSARGIRTTSVVDAPDRKEDEP